MITRCKGKACNDFVTRESIKEFCNFCLVKKIEALNNIIEESACYCAKNNLVPIYKKIYDGCNIEYLECPNCGLHTATYTNNKILCVLEWQHLNHKSP